MLIKTLFFTCFYILTSLLDSNSWYICVQITLCAYHFVRIRLRLRSHNTPTLQIAKKVALDGDVYLSICHSLPQNEAVHSCPSKSAACLLPLAGNPLVGILGLLSFVLIIFVSL